MVGWQPYDVGKVKKNECGFRRGSLLVPNGLGLFTTPFYLIFYVDVIDFELGELVNY